jgi:hypothetical protein
VRRYRFRLAQVQRVRAVQEDLAVAALAAARLDEARATAVAAAQRSDLGRLGSVLGSRPGGERQRSAAVVDSGSRGLTEADAAAEAAALRTAAAIDAWTLAARRVRALELLDARRREEHRLEAERAEAAVVDDLVVGRFAREEAG